MYNNLFSGLLHLFLPLLTMSSRVFLSFPPHGHKPLATLCGRLNPQPCLKRDRFLVYAECPDVAVHTIDPALLLFILLAPSSPHYTPSRFPNTIRFFGNHPALIRMMSASPPTNFKSLLLRKVELSLAPSYCCRPINSLSSTLFVLDSC